MTFFTTPLSEQMCHCEYSLHIYQLVTNDLLLPLYLNIGETVFQLRNDPLSLFPNRKSNHYNSKGYHLIVKQITKRLKVDGFFKWSLCGVSSLLKSYVTMS